MDVRSDFTPRVFGAEPVKLVIQVLIAGFMVHDNRRAGDQAGSVEYPGDRMHDRRVPGWRYVNGSRTRNSRDPTRSTMAVANKGHHGAR